MTPDPDPDPLPDPVPPRIPLVGGGEYRGPISLGFDAGSGGVTLTGALVLTADFDNTTAQITGEASSFQALNGGGFTGSVFLTRGIIDRAAATGEPDFDGTVSGALQGSSESYVVFGNFDGGFAGTGVQAVSGDIAGTVRTSGVDTALTGTFSGGRVP